MVGMKGSMSTLLPVFVIPMAKFTPRRSVIPFRTPHRGPAQNQAFSEHPWMSAPHAQTGSWCGNPIAVAAASADRRHTANLRAESGRRSDQNQLGRLDIVSSPSAYRTRHSPR
jgi:hypothetical protein